MSSPAFPLSVGSEAMLFGAQQRVVGAAKFSVRDGLTRLYWHEHYLRDREGNNHVLVYEIEEGRPLWKRFFLDEIPETYRGFELEYKGPGDRIVGDGTSYGINYKGVSRVEDAEGECPEGVVKGAKASFFNAADQQDLFVVSWTGEEVEYYKGRALVSGLVERAFGLPVPRVIEASRGMEFSAPRFERFLTGGGLKVAGILIFIFVLVFTLGEDSDFDFGSGARNPDPVKSCTIRSGSIGASGVVAGTRLEVQGLANEEWRSDGLREEVREYVVNDSGRRAEILLNGVDGDPSHWVWLKEEGLKVPLTPKRAGALVKNQDLVSLGIGGTVARTFQMAIRETFGREVAGVATRTVLYGASGGDAETVWLLRWDENRVYFFTGKRISEAEVKGLR